MPVTKRGKASVSGVAGSFDVILYPVPQSMKLSHKFDMVVTKDAQGDDAAWKANNELVDGDWMMKLLGATSANAKAGGAFLAPLAVITVTSSDLTINNTTWCVVPDSSIDLKNDDVGDIAFKVRRYVDSTQNTLFQTIPT